MKMKAGGGRGPLGTAGLTLVCEVFGAPNSKPAPSATVSSCLLGTLGTCHPQAIYGTTARGSSPYPNI